MNTEERKKWWDGLEEQWKRAFNEALFNRTDTTETPSDEELDLLLTSPVLRLVGPGGSYGNLSFKLTNPSGVQALTALETLVLTDHELESVQELTNLIDIKALFLFNNKLKSLEGLENMKKLDQLYVNDNELEDLTPISELPSLTVLNCAYNKIKEMPLPPKIKELYCLPNPELSDAEVIRIERNKGIRCRRG